MRARLLRHHTAVHACAPPTALCRRCCDVSLRRWSVRGRSAASCRGAAAAHAATAAVANSRSPRRPMWFRHVARGGPGQNVVSPWVSYLRRPLQERPPSIAAPAMGEWLRGEGTSGWPTCPRAAAVATWRRGGVVSAVVAGPHITYAHMQSPPSTHHRACSHVRTVRQPACQPATYTHMCVRRCGGSASQTGGDGGERGGRCCPRHHNHRARCCD